MIASVKKAYFVGSLEDSEHLVFVFGGFSRKQLCKIVDHDGVVVAYFEGSQFLSVVAETQVSDSFLQDPLEADLQLQVLAVPNVDGRIVSELSSGHVSFKHSNA